MDIFCSLVERLLRMIIIWTLTSGRNSLELLIPTWVRSQQTSFPRIWKKLTHPVAASCPELLSLNLNFNTGTIKFWHFWKIWPYWNNCHWKSISTKVCSLFFTWLGSKHEHFCWKCPPVKLNVGQTLIYGVPYLLQSLTYIKF